MGDRIFQPPKIVPQTRAQAQAPPRLAQLTGGFLILLILLAALTRACPEREDWDRVVAARDAERDSLAAEIGRLSREEGQKRENCPTDSHNSRVGFLIFLPQFWPHWSVFFAVLL